MIIGSMAFVHRWAHEVSIMHPIVIDGDLSKIK